jgi:hypothetical protein
MLAVLWIDTSPGALRLFALQREEIIVELKVGIA